MRLYRLICAAALAFIAVLAAPVPATAAGTTATVSTGGTPLNVRTGGFTIDRLVRTVPNGSRIGIACQIYGQYVSGPVRRTAYWNRLRDGGYVSDAYIRWSPRRPDVPWCGAGGAVAAIATNPGATVNLRSAPATSGRVLWSVRSGTRLSIVCQAWGERVAGTVRTSNAWNRLTGGQYVADAYVTWHPSGATLPWCGQYPPTIAPANAAHFLARVAGPARAGMRQYGVPASVTIAQAILESGWARSVLTRRDHNYFGIKCFGSPGTIAVGCRPYATYECGARGCYRTWAQFRAYRHATGSFADHGYFLRVNPRYRPAFAWIKYPDQFAREIHKAGYATSPTYSKNLINIMRQYDLYRYDRP